MTTKRLQDLILGDSLKMVKPEDRKAFLSTVKYYFNRYDNEKVLEESPKITLKDLID